MVSTLGEWDRISPVSSISMSDTAMLRETTVKADSTRI
jgi:hypothetical protein